MNRLAGKKVAVTMDNGSWIVSDVEDRVSTLNDDGDEYVLQFENSQRYMKIKKESISEVIESEDEVQIIMDDGMKFIFGFDLTNEDL